MDQILNLSVKETTNSGTHRLLTLHFSYCPGDGFEPLIWYQLSAGQTTSIGSILQAPERLFDSSEQMLIVLEN
jgi:hypothetical protein